MTGLPDVLMGDIFVEALSAVHAEEIRGSPDFAAPDEEVILSNGGANSFRRSVELSSIDRIAMVDKDQCEYYLFTTPGGGSGVMPPTVCCDACGLLFRKSSAFVRCAECLSPIVFLCAMCFSTGAQFGTHKRTHGYVVITSRNNGNLFSKNSSAKLGKLAWSDVINFFSKSEQLGFINYAELERSLGVPLEAASSGARRGGRGMRTASTPATVEETPPTIVTEVEKVYLSLVNVLTRNFAEDPSELAALPPPTSVNPGGPANYNPLRVEFEHEFLPEAETILAALSSSTSGMESLFEAYSSLQDERERRRKIIVEANLLHLREFAASKKKDAREMFEKCKMFIRPALKGGGLEFVESLATLLTQRKRCLERLKRLNLLQLNGVTHEDAAAVQFDLDRKKRSDLNGRAKVWTFLPNNKGETSAESAIRALPGGALLSAAAVALCAELHIAPQHFLGVKLAIEQVKKRSMTDFDKLIRDGIFGTTRRYLLAAQGLPVSATGGSSTLSVAEMKTKLIDCCLEP